MRLPTIAAVSFILSALGLGLASPASAQEPAGDMGQEAQAFVRKEHDRIEQILHEAASQGRDAQVHQALSAFVDYQELTQRAFGEPCPVTQPQCQDLWAGYSEAQRTEVRGLLEQLVRKTYQRNLLKTLDYDVRYRGARESGGDTRVMTEAQNRNKPREPPARVDYVVKETPSGLKVVDIITEGSSLTKNYYDQFRKKMSDPKEGYPNIVQKLKDKIAKKD